MWAIFRVLFSSAFLLSIVLSIPLAFDVGGRDSGLAYSLALFAFYTTYSTVRAVTPAAATTGRVSVRWLVAGCLRWLQWLVIPSLLLWALSRYAVDAGSSDWVARTVSTVGFRPRERVAETWWEWLFATGGVADTLALGGWDRTLRYSSPVFQLLEGFCSLLVIQAAGRIARWLVNRGRSDLWVVSLPGHVPIALGNPCPIPLRISANLTNFIDRPSRHLRIHHLDGNLLPLADRPLPSDKQRRRYADRHHHDIGHLHMLYWNHQRPREPC